MALQEGDRVVAVRDFGGLIREAVPAGATGRDIDAPRLAPARAGFELRNGLLDEGEGVAEVGWERVFGGAQPGVI
jgi:hypothetical protein